MGRTPKTEESWMPEAAELIVRESKSLKEAVTQLSIPLTTAECENLARRAGFQRLIRQARHRYRAEVASDPGRNKQSTIGLFQILVEKLVEEGELDKAAEVLYKLARVENWVGEGGNINVFAGLTQKDLDEMRAKIKEGSEGAKLVPKAILDA
jgi:hypothetical protein